MKECKVLCSSKSCRHNIQRGYQGECRHPKVLDMIPDMGKSIRKDSCGLYATDRPYRSDSNLAFVGGSV